MCKYYGYVRVSTETQAEKGYGLNTQEDKIKAYAKQQGVKLEKIYSDAGISGNLKDDETDDAINKRQGLIEMLSMLSEGDTVIVLNTSRLWRSDLTKAIVRRELMKRKVSVTSIEQPRYDLYSKDPNEYLITAIMEALDVYERMSISVKLAAGRATKAKKGDKPAGVCPYGYKYSSDKKSVEIDPDEAQAVKLMFTLGQKGESLSCIQEAITQAGYMTRHGKEFARGSIQAILRNRFYIGELEHQKQVIKGNHEPLISKIQFGKVAAQLEKRHR